MVDAEVVVVVFTVVVVALESCPATITTSPTVNKIKVCKGDMFRLSAITPMKLVFTLQRQENCCFLFRFLRYVLPEVGVESRSPHNPL